MSLVGFKASNHPQQTGLRGAKDDVDDRGTRWEEFNPISERFGGFTLDVAAAPHNAKCLRYFTIEDDGLQQSWSGRVWCNPPYSDLGAWVAKAWMERVSCETIVMLVPANRTEQKWWQDYVEPARRNGTLQVEFLPGRMRFDRPNSVIGPKGDRPPFGCALLIWERPEPKEISESDDASKVERVARTMALQQPGWTDETFDAFPTFWRRCAREVIAAVHEGSES